MCQAADDGGTEDTGVGGPAGREAARRAARAYRYPWLSPDGTKVAVEVQDQEADIWIWDLARQALTGSPSIQRRTSTVWTPDGGGWPSGRRAGGPPNVFWQAATATASSG